MQFPMGPESSFKMTPRELCQKFAAHSPPMTGHTTGIPAAVLVPVFFAGSDLMVLFIQRTVFVKAHRGQISFPGGKCDGADPDPLTTALRETQEEIGLPPAQVQVLGFLGSLTTVTGFKVDGFAGLIPFPASLQPNPREVARVFAYPVRQLCQPQRWRRGPHTWQGYFRDYVYFCHLPGALIWGATARLLVEFLTRLEPEFDPAGIPLIKV